MDDQRIRPGDMVTFEFWSNYLAPSAISNDIGLYNWYELQPGDQGVIIAIEPHVTSSKPNDNTVIVMFSRVGHLLRVHVDQIRRISDQ